MRKDGAAKEGKRGSSGGVVTYIGRNRCCVSSAVVRLQPPPPRIKPPERESDWQRGTLDCLFALRWTTRTRPQPAAVVYGLFSLLLHPFSPRLSPGRCLPHISMTSVHSAWQTRMRSPQAKTGRCIFNVPPRLNDC